MESIKPNQISINIPNYSGPLEVLLDLAKSQKVDLAEISITKLADEFLEYIKNNENLDLEAASEYLLMATWLAYLKSKLLLPDDEEDDFKALEVAEKLKLQLKKLELIRILSDQMLKKKRLGVHIFTRGMTGGIRSIYTPTYDISLYELLKTYSNIQMHKTFQTIRSFSIRCILATSSFAAAKCCKTWAERRSKIVPQCGTHSVFSWNASSDKACSCLIWAFNSSSATVSRRRAVIVPLPSSLRDVISRLLTLR